MRYYFTSSRWFKIADHIVDNATAQWENRGVYVYVLGNLMLIGDCTAFTIVGCGIKKDFFWPVYD